MAEPLSLSSQGLADLQRLARRSEGRVCERLHYVRLFARGYDLREIAELYEVDERTVVTWLERFREGGVTALADRPRSGRPRAAGVAAVVEATLWLEGAPNLAETGRTTWTRALLARHLRERMGCWLSERSVGRLLQRLGFVWTRPKLTLRGQDPAAAERENAIQAAIAQYPAALRFYEDEADVHQLPVIRGQYQRRGEQREVPTPGNNRKQPVFGFLNVLTGDWYYWFTSRKRSIDFITCLHDLLLLYPTGPILLFLDNASIHKSHLTLRWLAQHPRLIVCYLPAYSGHQTNPVEKVWWELKGEIMANYMHPSLEAVQDAICGFFATFSRERALRLVARHEQEGRLRATQAAGTSPSKELLLAA